jgi:hypothetical protein
LPVADANRRPHAEAAAGCPFAPVDGVSAVEAVGMTDDMCPRCGKGMQQILLVDFCKDQVHCQFNELTHEHWEILRDAFEQVAA